MRAKTAAAAAAMAMFVTCTVLAALYFPSPAPLPMEAEFRNELPWLRSCECSAERDLKDNKSYTLSQDKSCRFQEWCKHNSVWICGL